MAKVTLSDIAEKIGCSIATVSYALNRTRPISEEMERRIWETATELGYRPPCHRNRPSRKFIIILERRGNPVGEISQQFFQEAILRRGYLPLNCMSTIDVDEVQEVLSSLERANSSLAAFQGFFDQATRLPAEIDFSSRYHEYGLSAPSYPA